ncbi:MAG TPA: hypothetical protein PLB16_13050, partial [bacterium]|nr:hypothetical protein [bacterium]
MSISSTPYGQNNNYFYELPDNNYSIETTFHFNESDLSGNSYAGVLFAIQENNWHTCLFRRDNNE